MDTTFVSGTTITVPWLNDVNTKTYHDTSSTVSYTPAGTSAVATTVQAKLRESVSVLDFGTAPLTTVQFQSAVTAAAGKTLIVNAQVNITSTVTVPSGTTVEVVNGGYFTCTGAFRVKFTDHVSVYSWWWGSALTDVPIQQMFDSLSLTNGGVANIAAGNFVIGTGITAFGINNLQIIGAGQDTTVLTASISPLMVKSPTASASPQWGVITINAISYAGTAVNNIVVKELTTVYNGGMPDNADPQPLSSIKNFYFGWCTNILFEKVTIRQSRWEALYHDGPVGGSCSYVTVTNCQFYNTNHNAFNLNDGQSNNIIVSNNFFTLCAYGVQVVGQFIIIADNVFNSCNTGILVAEANSYPIATADCYAVSVTGNVIQYLGVNQLTTRDCYGIHVIGGDSEAQDGTVDNGILISNNVINNTAKVGANIGAIVAIAVTGGNATVSNNKISGLNIQNSLTGDCEAYRIESGLRAATYRQQCYISNNTLDNTLDTVNVFGFKWKRGFTIHGSTGSDYYFSNNVITAVDTGNYAMYIVPISGTPNIYLNGDILNGYIYWPGGVWDPVINAGELNNTPLFGASTGSITTPTSTGVIVKTLTNNSATPSVVGFNMFYASNSSATTITNLTGGITGQQITIIFTNSNTSIADNSNIKLASAFTSTADDVMRLVCVASVWYEISRSVN